jgi:lincosamide nucleotidyltransferase A/C/D/E
LDLPSFEPPPAARGDDPQAMAEREVLSIIGALTDSALRVWIDGGWGIDALLGSQTRPHADLDLVIDTADCVEAQSALAGLGFRHDPSARPGLPARLVLRDGGGRRVDLHPVTFDDHGNGWQRLSHGAWGLYPADGLSGRGVVGGRAVGCLTPELQLRHHLGYPPREADRHDVGLLSVRFGLRVPPDLRPAPATGEDRP